MSDDDNYRILNLRNLLYFKEFTILDAINSIVGEN